MSSWPANRACSPPWRGAAEVGTFKRIVCCLDFSEHAGRAVEAAKAQARLDGARLTLLNVLAPGRPLVPGGDPTERKRLSVGDICQRLEAEISSRYLEDAEDLRVDMELRRGHPSIEILAYLEESGADLVVVGSAGFSGVNLVLLGSVAERVSRRAPCSCLVVRPKAATEAVISA